jgi:hypothetical protein
MKEINVPQNIFLEKVRFEILNRVKDKKQKATMKAQLVEHAQPSIQQMDKAESKRTEFLQ